MCRKILHAFGKTYLRPLENEWAGIVGPIKIVRCSYSNNYGSSVYEKNVFTPFCLLRDFAVGGDRARTGYPLFPVLSKPAQPEPCHDRGDEL